VIGDFHIPTRARNIPEKLREIIMKTDIELILCTGDFVEERVLRKLEGIARTIWVVGNMDFFASSPLKRKLKVNGFKIGLIHGHQVYPRGDREKLLKIARSLNVNILISGHTHAPFIDLKEGVLLLNPGSATGCWGGGGGSLIPSLMIMHFREQNVLIELYELRASKLIRHTECFRLHENKVIHI